MVSRPVRVSGPGFDRADRSRRKLGSTQPLATGLGAFALAAGEFPVGDPFGWGDAGREDVSS